MDDSKYQRIALWIDDGDIEDAAQLLSEVPREYRTAEWHYLNGRILEKRGFHNDARFSYLTATKNAPDVAKYKDALQSLEATVGNANVKHKPPKQPKGKTNCCCCNCDTSREGVGECCIECSCACCCEALCEGIGNGC